MPIIGAHVSSAGSISKSFENAQKIGAEATQIFLAPPQMWVKSVKSEEEVQKYNSIAQESRISENFVHGSYLINLGTDSIEHLNKSIDWLTYALNECGKLNIKGVIFHTGSHKGRGFEEVLPQVVQAIKDILKNSPQNVFLILETAAGAGNVIGDKFEELGKILKNVNDPRLKTCLDTCHVYAAGYEINTKQGLDESLAKFEQEIGLNNLVAIHANDSKFEISQNKDRHANIGEGYIGKDGFKLLLNHPKLSHLPFLLEVPGFDDLGPDKQNVDILKSLLQ